MPLPIKHDTEQATLSALLFCLFKMKCLKGKKEEGKEEEKEEGVGKEEKKKINSALERTKQ